MFLEIDVGAWHGVARFSANASGGRKIGSHRLQGRDGQATEAAAKTLGGCTQVEPFSPNVGPRGRRSRGPSFSVREKNCEPQVRKKCAETTLEAEKRRARVWCPRDDRPRGPIMKKAKLYALAAILTMSLSAGTLQAGDFDAAPSFFEAVWARVAAVLGLGENAPVSGNDLPEEVELGDSAPVGGTDAPEDDELGMGVPVSG